MKLFTKLFGAPKRYYRVGDVAPESLLNRKPRIIGAFVVIDPETNIITRIWAP